MSGAAVVSWFIDPVMFMQLFGRSNKYDGVLEYFVVVRERAENKEVISQEEHRRKRQKARSFCEGSF